MRGLLSELVKGRRYSIIVGDEHSVAVDRSIYNIVYRGVFTLQGEDHLCFESDYMIHLVEPEFVREVKPWPIQI